MVRVKLDSRLHIDEADVERQKIWLSAWWLCVNANNMLSYALRVTANNAGVSAAPEDKKITVAAKKCFAPCRCILNAKLSRQLI